MIQYLPTLTIEISYKQGAGYSLGYQQYESESTSIPCPLEAQTLPEGWQIPGLGV